MIYLDHAAATPVSSRAKKAMEPYLSEDFFNPSSPYLPAKRVREAYEAAKADLAHTIGAKPADLIITSGATESINLAFTAIGKSSQVLYLATEHDAVKNTAAQFTHHVIKVDKNGMIDLDDFKKQLTEKIAFVSIALVSGELGVIQPLAKIAEIIKQERQRRLRHGKHTPLYFHTDASQALGLLDINVARLGVDLLTLNSAKVYGPKGIGALYVGHDVLLHPITFGGGQEMGLRSGTENVPAMIGFATAAVDTKKHLAANRQKYTKYKAVFKEELIKHSVVPPLFLGSAKHQLATFCPISLPGVDAERLIYQLEQQEIYVSTGAACAASKGKKSESLKAIGLSESGIAGSLRITFGATNTLEQIRTAAKTIASLAGGAGGAGEDAYVPTSGSSRQRERTRGLAPVTTGGQPGARSDTCASSPVRSATVFVGMSGGVDSSVSALLLKEQGYHVIGAYMKNWSRDLPGMKCPWAEDLADAKRVATQLGIDFQVFDFEKDYKQKVVDYMLDEFRAGRTPNPDIMCNQEIKFKLFYDVAMEQGADFIATGHYARVGILDGEGGESAVMPTSGSIFLRSPLGTRRSENTRASTPATARRSELQREAGFSLSERGGTEGRRPTAGWRDRCQQNGTSHKLLLRATDDNKDQTYFLYRISQDALNHTIFPIGNMLKPDVKKLAAKSGFDVATKKESMGVCFVGEVGIKDFLKQYVSTAPGDIIDVDTGETVGTHDGAIFYTIGQRRGLDVGGGLPYYVTGKDMAKNEVYVSRNLNNAELWADKLELQDVILRKGDKKFGLGGAWRSHGEPVGASPVTTGAGDRYPTSQILIPVQVRLRHRGELIPAKLDGNTLRFAEKVKRPAPGQSAVFYIGKNAEICLGGGIIK